MKAITLYQPWATLIAIGAKTVETRSWSTTYRGPLAIHAAKRRAEHEKIGEWYIEPAWITVDGALDGMAKMSHAAFRVPLPLGTVVATCELVDVVPMVTDVRQAPGAPVVLDLTAGRFVRNGGHVAGWSEQETAARNDHLHTQYAYGHFAVGRYAWMLENVEGVDPVAVAGHQRLWEWPS